MRPTAIKEKIKQYDFNTHETVLAEAVVRRLSVKKGVLENFAKFIGKHLYQSLFFNKSAG